MLPGDGSEHLAEAVGRLLIVGFEGTDFSEVERLIVEVRPAGLIFFKRNYPGSPEALRALIDKAQRLAEEKLGRRLFMAIDHEGGLVQRLPEPYTRLPSAREAAGLSDEPLIAAEKAGLGARELAATGFNFNMAPVLDVAPEGEGGFIGSRAFSEDPERIIALGRAWLEAFRRAGVLGAGKHFPGLGEAVIDPHHELPVMDVGLESLRAKDLRPFLALMSSPQSGHCAAEAAVSGDYLGRGEAEAPPAPLVAVMTTHALYPALDGERPATFSAAIVNLIKGESGFSGAVLTDDLEMGAVVKNYPLGEAAVEAVAAGHDLALVCRRRDYVDECRRALIRAAEDGRLGPVRLADAHRRSARLLVELDSIRPEEKTLNEWFKRLVGNI